MPVRRHPLASSITPTGIPADLDLADRLQRSAALLGPLRERLAVRFYERLFAREPGLRGMFSADLTAQRARLGAMLEFVVAHVRQPEQLVGPLRDLGKRHVSYGVKREHYPIVVEEMVKAMVDVAAPGWTSDDTEDWRTALRLVGEIMQSGAQA